MRLLEGCRLCLCLLDFQGMGEQFFFLFFGKREKGKVDFSI